MKRLILIALALFISACAAPKKEKDAEAYYNRGVAWQKKGDYDRAITDYTKAIELNPNLAMAYVNRGSAYLGKSLYDQVISDCNKAIEINPKFAGAYVNRGHAYLGKGLYDQAISDCNKAIELNPNLAMAYNNRAISYHMKGEYDKAWEDVHKAQSLGYQVSVIFLILLREKSGFKDEQVGDLLGAEKAFEKNIYPQEACEEDCKKMFEEGTLRQGMTVEECIKVLCL